MPKKKGREFPHDPSVDLDPDLILERGFRSGSPEVTFGAPMGSFGALRSLIAAHRILGAQYLGLPPQAINDRPSRGLNPLPLGVFLGDLGG